MVCSKGFTWILQLINKISVKLGVMRVILLFLNSQTPIEQIHCNKHFEYFVQKKKGIQSSTPPTNPFVFDNVARDTQWFLSKSFAKVNTYNPWLQITLSYSINITQSNGFSKLKLILAFTVLRVWLTTWTSLNKRSTVHSFYKI